MAPNPDQCSDSTDVVDSALQIKPTGLTTSAGSEHQSCSALLHLSESANSAEWLHEYDCWVDGKVSTSPDRAQWNLLFPALEESDLLLSTKEEKENAQNNGKPSSTKSAKSKERRNNNTKVKPTEDAFEKQGKAQLQAIFGTGKLPRRQIGAALLGHLYKLADGKKPSAWFDVCPKSLATRVSRQQGSNGKKPSLMTVRRAIDQLAAANVIETLDQAQQKAKFGNARHNGRVARLTKVARNGTWQQPSDHTIETGFDHSFDHSTLHEICKTDSVESTPVQPITEKIECSKNDDLITPLHPLFHKGLITSEGQHGQRLNAAVLAPADQKGATAANSIHPLGDLMIRIQSSQTTSAIAAVMEACGTEEIGGVLNPAGSSNGGQGENQAGIHCEAQKEEFGGVLNPAGQVLAPAKPKPLENHPERASVDEKAEMQPTAPLDTSEDLPDVSEEELGQLFGPVFPFGSKIYIKHPQFSAPSLATVATAEQLAKYQIANNAIPVDHLVVVTIAGVTKAVHCSLISKR